MPRRLIAALVTVLASICLPTHSTARISGPGSPSFRLKPRAVLGRRLSRQRKLTLRVVVKMQDAAGNAATVTQKLTLTR